MGINKEEFNAFRDEVMNLDGNLPPANIIIAGKSGSGKSTLINAVFGKEIAKTGCGSPVTKRIKMYHEEGSPVRIWDTVGLELDPKITEETIKDIRELIRKKGENKEDKFDRIHTIWYCVQAVGERIEDVELDFIIRMSKLNVPFTIVLTKCIKKKADIALSDYIDDLLNNNGIKDIPIIRVLAQDWEIDDDFIVKKKGLQELIDVTASNLETSIVMSFYAAQKVNKEMKRIEAEKTIVRHCTKAKEALYSKIPVVNIFTTSSSISKMFKEIGFLYNTQLTDDDIKAIYKYSIGEWKGKLSVLVNPLPMSKESKNFFEKKVKNQIGFENNDLEFKYYEKAAQLIAWSGYSWIFAIEQFWDELIEAESDDARTTVINKMKEALRKYMKNRV